VTQSIKALGAVLIIGIAVLLGSARPAAAATPCWKKLLNDWYDGRIDNVYPVHCYQDTLKHLPEDVSVYSSARDDILRALQSARANLRKKGKVDANTPVPAQTTTEQQPPPPPTTAAAPTTTHRRHTTTTPGKSDAGGGNNTGGSPGRKPDKGLPGVAQQLNPSSPSSVPVPLIVLGALALLLVAAGAIGFLMKRLQARGPKT
jgi:hypothetical protein